MRVAVIGCRAMAEPDKRMSEFDFYFGRRLWVSGATLSQKGTV
jgi:hypothetical protein